MLSDCGNTYCGSDVNATYNLLHTQINWAGACCMPFSECSAFDKINSDRDLEHWDTPATQHSEGAPPVISTPVADVLAFCEPLYFFQVECKPPGPIILKVANYRESGGGFLGLTLSNVAGDGGIRTIEIRSSPSGVSQAHS